jgi:hypothetical protein
MSEKVQLKGNVSGINFGYNAKMEVYANLSLDIPKLGEILGENKWGVGNA